MVQVKNARLASQQLGRTDRKVTVVMNLLK